MWNAHLLRQTSAVKPWENSVKKGLDDTCQNSTYMYDNANTIFVVFKRDIFLRVVYIKAKKVSFSVSQHLHKQIMNKTNKKNFSR